ncbi:hypothetical protein CB1_000968026 [Camelus ferus]|nr:hypothetical protein CB1_000968026 [Camelus ferus]
MCVVFLEGRIVHVVIDRGCYQFLSVTGYRLVEVGFIPPEIQRRPRARGLGLTRERHTGLEAFRTDTGRALQRLVGRRGHLNKSRPVCDVISASSHSTCIPGSVNIKGGNACPGHRVCPHRASLTVLVQQLRCQGEDEVASPHRTGVCCWVFSGGWAVAEGRLGETMRIASSEFADDPCSSVKRGTMVRAARALLSAVTRLLILADMADVMRLLSHLKIVEEALEAVKNATNEQDLANRFKEFGKEMVKLNYVAARRQQELKDPHCRDEMAAARGALKKNATMLYTASQAFLRHPDVAATRANRDYVFKQVQEAIAGISNAAQATSPTDEAKGHTGIGELAAALNEFDGRLTTGVITFGIREADVMGSLSVVASELRCVWVKTALSSSC